MWLIDADVALRHKRKMSGADFGGEFWDEAVLVSDIMNASPVDAVEVVRCKDCKHWHKDTVFCDYMPYGEASERVNWYADDFCSYGELKQWITGNEMEAKEDGN